jgi:N-acetylneuraminic acid mutarotase
MPTPRTEFGVATVNDKLYAIGGYSGSVLRTVEEYDPATDTWTAKTDMPTARRLLVVATVNNKIYAIGGMNYTNPNSVTYTYATEEYDPPTDTWTVKTPMPTGNPVNTVLGNRFMGGAAANGKIYVAVFNNNGFPPITQTFEYDPAADTWSSKAPVPFDYTRFALASVNGKIYALSDANYYGYAFLAEYDPSRDIWIIKPPMLTDRSWTGMVGAAGKLYAVGGAEGAAVLNAVEEFDASTDNWALRASMPTKRCSPAIGEINGKIYVIGGSANTSVSTPQPLSVVEEGTLPSPGSVLQIPAYIGVTTGNGTVTVSWSSVAGATSYNLYMASNPSLDKNHYGMKYTGAVSPFVITGLTNNQTYYFFVTAVDGERETEDSLYVTATPTAPPDLLWTTPTFMPTPRTEPGIAVVNGTIYVIGGYSGSTLSTVESYNPVSATWIPKADMPTARRSPVVAAVNNKIYAIGGMNYSNPNHVTYSFDTDEYDPATDTWTSKASIPDENPVNSVLGNRFIGGAATNGKVYVVVFTPGQNFTYEYDPASDTWINKSPIPIGGLSTPYAVAALNNKIYVLAASNFAEYNPSTDTWIIKAPLPGNRSLAGLVAVPSKSKLYAVGGMDGSGNVLGSITEYNPVSNTWTTRASMPTPRHSVGTGEVGGKIYVIGGSDSPMIYSPLPNDDVEVGL